MAYLTPSEFIVRYDARRVAELLTVNVSSPVTVADLPGNSSLIEFISDASGEIEAAITVGNKYTPVDLAAMTGTAASLLKRMVSDLVWVYLLVSRGMGDGDVEAQAPRYKETKRMLAELYNGSMVFGIADNRNAGLPKVVDPNPLSTNSPSFWNMMFGKFGNENYPYGY